MLVTAALGSISNLTLSPSASIAAVISAITPAAGYGPLPGDIEHTLPFHVLFHGIACKPEAQIFTGTIDVVADGSEITCASDIVVTAVYTASGAGGEGISMEVVQVASRRS